LFALINAIRQKPKKIKRMKGINKLAGLLLFIGFSFAVDTNSNKIFAQESLPPGDKDGDCFYCLGYQPNTVVQIICWEGTHTCIGTACTNGLCHWP
jgi:hypothetical protein